MLVASIILYTIRLSNNEQLYPIFIAVSVLSPVNTHILIPASLKAAIVSSTSSYNLSSIAVDPISTKFDSIISAISFI
jgi:multisubunit Na+/H+ antiporter MnhG subunit